MATKQTGNATKTISKAAKKKWKNLPAAVKAVFAVCLLVGIGLGAFVCIRISENDRFELKGEKNFTVEIGSDFLYEEEGLEAVCFGMDVSGKASVTTSLEKDASGKYVIPTAEEGVYTITYTVDALKFNGSLSEEEIKRVRTFTVVSTEEDGHNE